MSNNYHQVHSGVTILKKNKSVSDFQVEEIVFHETSNVLMAHLDDSVIQAYIETGEPMDKAGAYGIQALGSSLVKSIDGDFFNVEGFPAHKFAIELRKFLQL